MCCLYLNVIPDALVYGSQTSEFPGDGADVWRTFGASNNAIIAGNTLGWCLGMIIKVVCIYKFVKLAWFVCTKRDRLVDLELEQIGSDLGAD